MVGLVSCEGEFELIKFPDLTDRVEQGTVNNPYSVADVIAINPTSTTVTTTPNVWVQGYIVGYRDSDVTPSADYFGTQESYNNNLNLFLADSYDEKDINNCVSIQVTSELRTVLGLQSNPENMYKTLNIKGDLMKYNGIAGVKNTTTYLLDGEGPGEIENSDVSVSGDASKAAELVEEYFTDAVANSAITIDEWQNIAVEGNRTWTGKTFDNNGYAQATAHNATAGAKYETWLITQGLDLSKAESKTFSFKTAQAYWQDDTVFEVYVLQNNGTKTVRTKLENLTLATSSTPNYTFVSSGNIDLSAYSGILYIGFRYVGDGGSSKSTTWCVDDVLLGKEWAAKTEVSVKATDIKAISNESFESTITTVVVNEKGNTVITAEDMPSWITLKDNGNGTATLSGTAPAEAQEISIKVKAVNNGVEATANVSVSVLATQVSIKASNIFVNLSTPFEAVVSATVVNGLGNTVISSDDIPSWITLTNNGDGTATLAGNSPAEEQVSTFNIKAVNNGIEALKEVKITVKAPTEGDPDNLVLNGSFIEETNGWTLNNSDKYTINTSAGFVVTQSDDVNELPSGTLGVVQIIDIEPGVDYVLSFEYKANERNNKLWSSFFSESGESIYYYGSSSTSSATKDILRTNNTTFAVSEEWTPMEIEFTAPEGAVKMNLEFRITKKVSSESGITNISLKDK